jgi:hypothetical protein
MEVEMSINSDEKVIYYFSKRILWTPVFIFAFIAFTVSPVFLFNQSLVIDIIFISFSVFMFLLMIDLFRGPYYFFVNKPALILTNENLIDNINQQVYRWPDIFDITLHSYSKIIWINIGDGYKTNYLNRRTGLKRWLLKLHLDLTHGAFWINPKAIEIDKNELMDKLRKYHTHKL